MEGFRGEEGRDMDSAFPPLDRLVRWGVGGREKYGVRGVSKECSVYSVRMVLVCLGGSFGRACILMYMYVYLMNGRDTLHKRRNEDISSKLAGAVVLFTHHWLELVTGRT